MRTHKELLLSLRGGFEQLELFDRAKLNGLKDRGQMIIRRAFGQDSVYSERLSRIEFRYMGMTVGTLEGGDSAATRQARQRAWLSGQKEAIALIDTMLEDLELSGPEQVQSIEVAARPTPNRVFVVHGQDDGMRESVARVLTTLGLEPVILHEQADRGRTIIEKFYEHSDVGFAVVLLSPDDSGYLISDGPDAVKPRARQNVILELGFFLGRLGRENVVALYKGDVEIPSDFSGVLYKRYDSDGAWPYKLTRELKESGYEVSADNL